MLWHSSDINDIKNELKVDEKVGLASSEIAERIATYGENKRTGEPEKNIIKKIFKHLTSPIDILLTVLSAIVLVTDIVADNGSWYLPVIVLVLLILNALADVLIGVKSEDSVQKLRGNIAASAKVIRDGELTSVPASLLVPGDIVMLEAGDYIPADGRLIESYSLTCDESAVSGDAAPNEKQADFTPEDIATISQRKNMVYAGCSVLFGRGKMIVTDTGMNTELARQDAITEIIVGSDIPVKRRLVEIGNIARIAVLVSCFIFFVIGIFRGASGTDNFALMILNLLFVSAALAAAVIPEDAAQAVNIVLGFGAHRMLGSKAIIQNPSVVESLGKVSLIISDKTGTLTKNKMKMTMLYDGNDLIDLNVDSPSENAVTLIRTAALCGNSTVQQSYGGKVRPVGDPTEVSIVTACMEYCGLGKEEVENIYPRMAEVPFESSRKLMTTINMINNRPFAIVKGSPDILIKCCVAGNIKGAAEAAEEMGKRGLRAIALAMKPLDEVPANPNPDNMECDLTFMGMFGMTDTISRETTSALRESEGAGIRTVMITGDHVTAAESIAKGLGILKEGQKAVTGEELREMDDETLRSEILNIAVYSRIDAEDKMRILETFKDLGETVAITGDSVEDAAILKSADVGCAMGVTGTDISKGAADIVLTEDSYISIVGAIKSARGIYENIKRIASLVLSTALGELAFMLLFIIIFGTPALGSISLLWLNLVVGFGLILGLSSEKAGKGIMLSPPRRKKESFFGGEYGISVIWQGAEICALGFIAYALGGSAMLFAVLVLSETVLAFTLRSNLSLFKEGFHTNKIMLVVLAAVVVTLIIILGPLNGIFALGEFSSSMILKTVLLSLVPLAVSEIIKLVKHFQPKGE